MLKIADCKYWWDKQGDKTGTPVENFNWNCCVSIALLNIALMLCVQRGLLSSFSPSLSRARRSSPVRAYPFVP